jgi:hypothetical protein
MGGKEPSYKKGETLNQTIKLMNSSMLLTPGIFRKALPWFILGYSREATNQKLGMYGEHAQVHAHTVSRFQQHLTLRVSCIPSRPYHMLFHC